MLHVYAAWTEGMLEHDVTLIRKAMGFSAAEFLETPAPLRANDRRWPSARADWSVDWPVAEARTRVTPRGGLQLSGGKGGTRTLDPGIMSAVL
jgi:hypothetical protein